MTKPGSNGSTPLDRCSHKTLIHEVRREFSSACFNMVTSCSRSISGWRYISDASHRQQRILCRST